MPYRAQFSQRHDTTHDVTQSAVVRDEVSSLLQPAIKLPSSGTLLCGTFPPATPSPRAKIALTSCLFSTWRTRPSAGRTGTPKNNNGTTHAFPSCFYAPALLLLSRVSVQLQCSLCSAFRFLRRAAKYAALDSAGTWARAFARYQSMLFFMAILALKFSKSLPRRFHREQRHTQPFQNPPERHVQATGSQLRGNGPRRHVWR